MKCLTYQQVRKMYEDAMFAQDVYWTHGAFGEAIRYCKIANRLYNCMMNFPASNIQRSYAVLERGKKAIAESRGRLGR